MALWLDEYAPKTLSELTFHTELNDQFERIAQQGALPNLLFYGPPGAGKHTRIKILLKEIYGENVFQARIEEAQLETPSGRTVTFSFLVSKNHFELSANALGLDARFCLQQLLHDISNSHSLAANTRRPFKTIVIHEAEKLSRDAMHSLRRTMERNTQCLRFIFSCTFLSKIIPALKSRCLLFQIPAPDRENIRKVLQKIATERNLPDDRVSDCLDNSRGNLRRALLLFQTSFSKPPTTAPSGWEALTHNIAKKIQASQTSNTLLQIRTLLYDLLTHSVSATLIIKSITDWLLKEERCPNWRQIVSAAWLYENRAQKGTKEIYHLEAFCASVMCIFSSRWKSPQ